MPFLDYFTSEVGIFTWEAAWSKILTLDKLQIRGCALANRCYLLGKEDAIIFLFIVDLTRSVWDLLFSLFGVYLVLPSPFNRCYLVGKDLL